MPIHIDWAPGGLAAIWRGFHGPLIAFAVALGLAFAGRLLRSGWLAAAAGGAGVAAGWYAISGSVWVTSPRPSVAHLTLVAAVALVIGAAAARLSGRQAAVPGLLLAAFTGWWLCGAPRSRQALLVDWPVGLGVGMAVLVYARSLTNDALTPLRLALTGLTMASAFHIAMLPPLWVQLALAPAVASLALFALPPMPGLVALAVAVDIGALAGLAAIVPGRLPHLRVGPADVAAAAPLLALWLAPRLTSRLGFAGRAAPASAGVLAALIAVVCTWIAVRVLAR